MEVVPTEGWTVEAYHYFMADARRDFSLPPASLFLAASPDGMQRSVQWWSYGSPTKFHGSWEKMPGTLSVIFNCRGLEHRLRRTCAFKEARSAEGDPSYMGFDAAGRSVKMVYYGAWQAVQEESTIVWQKLSDDA